jgi:hypothetical protein
MSPDPRQCTDTELLTDHWFEPELAYFRNRYFRDGAFTYHFDNLNIRGGDQPDLVQKVLSIGAAKRFEIAAATLIIVYRFRNNLFHGEKWAYQLKGQLEIFTHANAVLMQAIELHRRLPRNSIDQL